MRKIYLIRHGTTAANEKNLYYGASDIDLSEKGRREVQEQKDKGTYPDFLGCKIIVSGMKRTIETLNIIFPNAEYTVKSGLSEMNFGKFEMRSYEEMKEDPEYQLWITGDYMSNVCPEGESGNMHCARAVKAFWEVFRETEGDLLIVSHSGTMISIMQNLFPDEGENRWYWKCYGGCGFAVDFDGETAVGYGRIE